MDFLKCIKVKYPSFLVGAYVGKFHYKSQEGSEAQDSGESPIIEWKPC